jgi:8-oxo-dGTP diphosphatase
MVEPGETVEEALVREIQEETGLAVDITQLMRVYTNRDSLPDRQHVEITYQCIYRSGAVQLDPSEHDSFAWVFLDDLRNPEFAVRDFLADLLSSPDFFSSIKNRNARPV